MKLQQLHVFVAVAEEKSLRAAARRLNLTQPAVTRTVQELEGELGVALMSRSVHGVELTEYGTALKSRAYQLLEDVRRAREELEQIKGEMRGKVSVGATPSIALTILPDTLQRFREAAPAAELTFTEVKFPFAVQLLRDGSIDFVASHVLPEMLGEDLLSLPLFSTDFVVLAREGHPLANARRISELAEAEWIVTTPSGGFQHSIMIMDTMFEREDVPRPRRVIQCSSFAIALGLVAGTDTLALFSRHLAQRITCFGLQQIPLEMQLPTVEMSIIMRKNILLTPVAQHFVTCLQATAKQLKLPA